MAYAIILREYQREGMSLEAALARLADWAADVTRSSAEREEELIAAQNVASLAEIEARLAGAGVAFA